MPRILLINNVILMLCCSIYLGTGISLVFFQFPIEPQLTPDNYSLIFVDAVQRATDFFTWMTLVMLVTGAVMLVTEWFSGLRWVPIVVLSALIASTWLTTQFIFVHNDALAAGITDPDVLAETFAKWASLNRLRVTLWCIEWGAMMFYFYALGVRARADK
ncbi:MAG: hypothetical protein ACSHW1_14085 [Yoonia sp.]|uniref:hypothetical protein n=1 Tax=Yoonia sp. TaxID=2212373 RepID=UPI003EF73419